MLSVQLSFAPYFGYRTRFVHLAEAPSTIAVSLEDGTHTFQSEDVDLGRLTAFENRRLLGRVVFDYTYDEAQRTVTVCGTDFASADSLRLVTFPAGTTEYCYHRAARSAGFAADDLTANRHWNCRVPLAPGLEEVLREMARAANESLIAGLRSISGLIVRIRQQLPDFSADDYRQLLTVYRDGVFHGPYDPECDLEPQDAVRTIESVWGGTVHFDFGEAFANVIGSTNDPKIDNLPWIQLWQAQFRRNAETCTSHNFRGFSCGNIFVGGHVVTGTVARWIPPGSDSVYIMPICGRHNANDNVYMAALKYQNGIWLKDYFGR